MVLVADDLFTRFSTRTNGSLLMWTFFCLFVFGLDFTVIYVLDWKSSSIKKSVFDIHLPYPIYSGIYCVVCWYECVRAGACFF